MSDLCTKTCFTTSHSLFNMQSTVFGSYLGTLHFTLNRGSRHVWCNQSCNLWEELIKIWVVTDELRPRLLWKLDMKRRWMGWNMLQTCWWPSCFAVYVFTIDPFLPTALIMLWHWAEPTLPDIDTILHGYKQSCHRYLGNWDVWPSSSGPDTILRDDCPDRVSLGVPCFEGWERYHQPHEHVC